MCRRGKARASHGCRLRERRDTPLAMGNGNWHCTRWCQDSVLLQVAEDISSVSFLDTQGFEGEPQAGMCLWSQTPSWDTSLAQREADHPVAGISTWSPLCVGVYGFAVGEASFLKCISSSRSLTIEALIKAEINFCQCTSRAQSVLFLQEPRPLARTECAAGRGELCRNKMRQQSQFAMPGTKSCWKNSCILDCIHDCCTLTHIDSPRCRKGRAKGFST